MTADEHMKKHASSDEQQDSWQKSLLLYLHDLITMLAVIMVIFLIVFRMVVVSGSSMYSTLWNGDWLLVLSNSFYREPEQGDIIVACKDSFNDGEAIIKRVIATEGQKVDIDFEQGVVYVDDKPLDEPYTYTSTSYNEGMVFPLTVEEGHVFAMGDNRNSSRDSRDPAIGQIDKREILGKALFLIFPGMGERDNTAPRDFNRIGALTDGR